MPSLATLRPGRRSLLGGSGGALLGLLGLAWAPAGAFDVLDVSPETPRDRPRFVADAGSRLGPTGPEVVLAFEVPYAELFFRPVGSRFEARFDVVLVLQRDGKQVGGDSFTEALRISRREEAKRRGALVRRSLAMPVPPGGYRAQVLLREPGAGRESRLQWDLEVPDYGRWPLSLSTLWPARGGAGADSTGALPPEGWILEHEYGDPVIPRLFVGEVYRADGGGDSTRLTWRVLGARAEALRRGELRLPPGARTAFAIAPDLGALWLGDYQLEVQVAADGREARRRCAFRMRATSHAFEADAEQSLELVELIAEPEELRRLRDTPVTERKDAWERFWRRRDPTPGTAENEFREEFFRRVRYANERFSVLGPGWRSDRGRVYIRHGPPDQVESYPFNLDGPAYEIWIYTRPMRRFVFVDYDGFGRYELEQPGRS